MKDVEENNFAFIDGQNLYMGTTQSLEPWKVDLFRFRQYLRKKYGVSKAFYFLGVVNEENNELYTKIQDAGFILFFRQHSGLMIGKKKGNVDSNIIFQIMKYMYKKENFDKIILVAGDGDYKMLVDFLIEENKFKKILFPNKDRASSLYKKIHVSFKSNLQDFDVKRKIKLN